MHNRNCESTELSGNQIEPDWLTQRSFSIFRFSGRESLLSSCSSVFSVAFGQLKSSALEDGSTGMETNLHKVGGLDHLPMMSAHTLSIPLIWTHV